MIKPLGYLVLTAGFGLSFGIIAADLNDTQGKLKQLDTKIQTLKQSLAKAEDKRGLLSKELADNEKQIGQAIQNLHQIEQDIDFKNKKIILLKNHEAELSKQLATQQELLAKHVRIRYQMSGIEPIKWIVNQDNPYTISHLLTFHQYLVQSRQNIIAQIDYTQKSLHNNQSLLAQEISHHKTLQNSLHHHQQQLENDRHYQTEVLNSINSDIQSKELMLSGYEQNKARLSNLLRNLPSTGNIPGRKAFASMRHKLPKPVAVRQDQIKKTSQGVMIKAMEGTPIHAVYPGKIVFSDWLNGYGLLLIIDHGQGFMTLYAHNQSLFKHKGSLVTQGEQIASVGHSGGNRQNGLYFEVRQHGKAVSPTEWLS